MSYLYSVNGSVDDVYMDVNITFTGVSWNVSDTQPDESSNDSTSNTWRYRFTVPSALSNKIAKKFGIDAGRIFQFSDSEILSSSGTLSTEDMAAISRLNETVIFTTPTFMPSNTGVYIMRYSIDSEYIGRAIKFHGISSGSSSDSDSSSNGAMTAVLESPSYTFYDENYNEITEVPSDGVIYAAVNMTAGRTSGGVITAEAELSTGTITPVPVEEQPALREKIAETLNEMGSPDITPSDILFITEKEIVGEAPEPNQDLKDEATKGSSTLVGKLSTLSVDKTGLYVFRVELSDELYDEVKNTSVEQLKIYFIQYEDDEVIPAADGEVNLAFITGLLNTFELLTMSGEKMQFGMKEFLMVGLLNAGKPMSFYIAKLILALLLGGCTTGFVPSAISLAVFGFVVLKHRKKK